MGLELFIECYIGNRAHFYTVLRVHRRADQLRGHFGGFEVHLACVSGGGAQEERDKTDSWQMFEHGYRAENHIIETEHRAVCSQGRCATLAKRDRLRKDRSTMFLLGLDGRRVRSRRQAYECSRIGVWADLTRHDESSRRE